MASEGGGGADLVGFIVGLILFGALVQTAMVQINKITAPIQPVTTAATQQPIDQPPAPAATSTRI